MATTKKISHLKPHGGERGVNVVRARGKSTTSAANAAEIDVDKPLTEQQRLFVEHWAKGDSITSAMLRAGYSEKGTGLGYRLVRQPNILALKAQYEAKYEASAEMSREKVMAGLMEAVEMAKLMSEPATMVSGWKTVGQMCGYFAPVEHRMKVDITGNIVIDKLNSMSDAELLKLITSGTPS
ncbi:MAG: terminase small subunit [Polaromonas sp.]|nr:terminase small subunit [Polaromonas sp.]